MGTPPRRIRRAPQEQDSWTTPLVRYRTPSQWKVPVTQGAPIRCGARTTQ